MQATSHFERMPIRSDEFRQILGHWVTGVAVVASRADDGEPCGFTANSFTSLSLDPPLVLVCVDRAGNSHDCIRAAGIFAVNVLGADREVLARRFAAVDQVGKFVDVPYSSAVTGAPVLDEAVAWVDCRVSQEYPGGDHTIFVGEVVAAGAPTGDPLIFYRGAYGRFTS